MSQKLQSLPGFRDFRPEDCAIRNYTFQTWRKVAHAYGFSEYEVPLLEPTELYTRKSGAEIVGQLFNFTDKGGREVAMRPEITPSLARLATSLQREYKKPLKWSQIGSCFRYETPQKGRGREFYQFNLDILGDANLGADAELVAMAIDTMLAFGFQKGDFRIRLSDRRIWNTFATAQGIAEERLGDFLQVIDKMEREKPAISEAKLADLGTTLEAVKTLMADPTGGNSPVLATLLENLAARGMAEYVQVDLGIVRGLAYYTGVVFEVFDATGANRAVAGGGRYDNLCKLIGGVDFPAVGFAMGDMVIADFITEKPHAKAKRDAWLAEQTALDFYIVVADETKRPQALALVQRLRQAGNRVDYAMSPAKIGNQLQAAENLKARQAVIVGTEYPQVNLRNMAHRTEQAVSVESVAAQ
jgi:histidyl-tRNA synthetase